MALALAAQCPGAEGGRAAAREVGGKRNLVGERWRAGVA